MRRRCCENAKHQVSEETFDYQFKEKCSEKSAEKSAHEDGDQGSPGCGSKQKAQGKGSCSVQHPANSLLDKAVTSHLKHKNYTARQKARLAKAVNSL